MTEVELKRYLEYNGFFNLRMIQGKLCGLYRYMFTYGLVIGLDEVGHERRYCYSKLLQASHALESYKDLTIHPSGPWIKCKGTFKGEPIDLINPEFK